MGTMIRNDMDTMADTSCARANWTIIKDTSQQCNIYLSKTRYIVDSNVSFATYTTLVEYVNRNDFMVIEHKMLYFGQEMKHSLLNQNQIRDNIKNERGQVHDDFTKHDKGFRIWTRITTSFSK